MPVCNDNNSDPSTSEQPTQTTRKFVRQIDRPSKYRNFYISYPSSTIASHSTGTNPYPLSSILSYSKLSPSYRSVILSITQNVEP